MQVCTLFETLDEDGSGEIDKHEFFQMCDEFGFTQNEQEIDHDKLLRDAFALFDREAGEEVYCREELN